MAYLILTRERGVGHTDQQREYAAIRLFFAKHDLAEMALQNLLRHRHTKAGAMAINISKGSKYVALLHLQGRIRRANDVQLDVVFSVLPAHAGFDIKFAAFGKKRLRKINDVGESSAEL